MKRQKLDEVIRSQNSDGTIVSGHLGGNEPVGYKYLHKTQTHLKKIKKSVKKEK